MGQSSLQCPVCGSKELCDLESVDVASQHGCYAPGDTAMQALLNSSVGIEGGQYQMQRCGGCGLEFACPLQAPPGGWYDHVYQVMDLYPVRRWEFGRVLDETKAADFVVEFGCGSGAFLNMCGERGIKAVGLDFSSSAVAKCRQSGLDARMLSVIGSDHLNLDVKPSMIVAFHVLEHLDAPLDLLKRARVMSGPDTRLWLSVPGDRRPTRWFGLPDLLDQPPHHMTRWCGRALAAAGAGTGWSLRNLYYETLPLPAALWYAATQCAIYQKLKGSGLLDSKLSERVVRWVLYPWAWVRRLTSLRALSGFTMLAEFIPGQPD